MQVIVGLLAAYKTLATIDFIHDISVLPIGWALMHNIYITVVPFALCHCILYDGTTYIVHNLYIMVPGTWYLFIYI